MTSSLAAVAPEYGATRDGLHRVAVHVCARRRFAATGRFGLRPTSGGFGTPAFGDPDHEEVLRVDGSALLREQRGPEATRTTVCLLDGRSLRDVGQFADARLEDVLSVGHDTPDLGDVDGPLEVDAPSAALLGVWFHLGAVALDAVVVNAPAGSDPSVAQLWPEHFDLACDLAVGGSRVNLGVSPGDATLEQPYAYVGPWTSDRPGDADYWNVRFGAVLPYDAARAARDPVAACVDFFSKGLSLLAS